MSGAEQLVLITGMSGAGKSTALRSFEDLGYFCIDNLPPTLIETFLQLYREAHSQGMRIAVVCDARLGELLQSFPETLAKLEDAGHNPQLLFLDCDDDRLVDRFNESRRTPPYGSDMRKPEALVVERRQLEPLKAQAAYTIDTTDLSAQQLRNRILGLFGEAGSREIVSVTLLSFGYKYGIPADADFVFDSRMLPNPFYDAGLRDLTGNDEPVSEFVLGLPAAGELLELIRGTLKLALTHYPSVHKFSAVIAVGCTGGKHRSVSLVNRLGQLLADDGAKCVVQHRDIDRV